MNIGDLLCFLGVEMTTFTIPLEFLLPLAVNGIHFVASMMNSDSHLLVLKIAQLNRALDHLVVTRERSLKRTEQLD